MKIFIFDVETFSKNKEIDESVKEYAEKENISMDMNDRIINFGLAVMKEMGMENWIVFEDKEKLRDFLLNKKPETYIFVGHNILNFDIFTIFTMDEILDNFDIVMNGSSILQMHSILKRVYFFDTFNIYKTSLKELGKMVNIQKGNLQEELKIMDRNEFFKRKNEIIEYCKIDVLITEKVFDYYLSRVREIKNIKKPKSIPFTSAMYSFTYYNYLNDYKINGKNLKNDNLFLETYYGGRTENFFTGKYDGNIYVYDVNSLYPFIMRNYTYPLQFLKEISVDENNKNLVMDYIMNYEGIALVKVNALSGIFGFQLNNGRFIDIGLLPLKRKIENEVKLLFPLGEYYSIYNFNELRYAMKKGYQIDIYYIQVWEKGKIPRIEEFVDHFYELKKDKKDSIEGFNAKVILNSLYGKFVQNQGKEDIIDENKYIENINEYNNKEIKVFENYIVARDKGIIRSISSYFNIGSYITSWARVYMLENIKNIIKEGGYIFYMDTDSIFTNIQISDKFLGDELGKFKLEKVSNGGTFFGAKSYVLDDKRKLKGIGKNAQLIKSNENEWVYIDNRIVKLKGYLRSDGLFYDKTVLKKLKYTSKRDLKNLNDFSDAIYINDDILYIQKGENIGKINYLLRENRLNLNIMEG
jgi:hypothetical protein